MCAYLLAALLGICAFFFRRLVPEMGRLLAVGFGPPGRCLGFVVGVVAVACRAAMLVMRVDWVAKRNLGLGDEVGSVRVGFGMVDGGVRVRRVDATTPPVAACRREWHRIASPRQHPKFVVLKKEKKEEEKKKKKRGGRRLCHSSHGGAKGA